PGPGPLLYGKPCGAEAGLRRRVLRPLPAPDDVPQGPAVPGAPGPGGHSHGGPRPAHGLPGHGGGPDLLPLRISIMNRKMLAQSWASLSCSLCFRRSGSRVLLLVLNAVGLQQAVAPVLPAVDDAHHVVGVAVDEEVVA